MRRREVLLSLTSATALSAAGCAATHPDDAAAADSDIQRLARMMTGQTLKPGQVKAVSETLASMRFKGRVAPSEQPAHLFDPEVDGE